MQERERLVATGLIVLMLVLWLGFAVHRSPRFAGSAFGGALGVSGAAFMLFSYFYALVKRVPVVKSFVTKRISLRALLAWHVYAGIVGAILGLLHTGHKFQSTLGILVTAMMLLVVLSGFVGRYLLSLTSQEIREKREVLSRLQAEYDKMATEISSHPRSFGERAKGNFLSRSFGRMLVPSVQAPDIGSISLSRAVQLVGSIADVDYAVKADERLKKVFSRWLKLHIGLSILLIVLLGLHVWSGIHYGLRWFQ